MFNSKSKNAFDESPSGASSIIGAGTVITGNLDSNADLRIDGHIKGNITTSAKILIGPDGFVEGDINGNQANILGKINGNIRVNDLVHLRGKATVQGNIYAGKLQIEPTVTFNGECHMGANVVELITERSNAVNG
jgi:cytoskeletal protein CcmA (bactofilin family)